MEFVIVPKGKSWLGGGKDKLGDKEVEIPPDFYLGKYEVTQEEWEKVMGENPSYFSRTAGGKDAVKDIPDADLKRFPVESVSWDDCQLFVAKLNKLEKETGWVYRLPKEVEWEYACRGGPMADKSDSAFDFYFDKPTNTLSPDQANFRQWTEADVQGGFVPAESLGFVRHARQRMGVVRRPVRPNDHEASHRVTRGGSCCVSAECCAGGGLLGEPAVGPRTRPGLRLARVPSGILRPKRRRRRSPSPRSPTPTSSASPPCRPPQQVEEVRKELMRRNPGFDGKMEHKIEDGVVTEFRIVTDQVTDIAPIRVFNALRVLDCSGTWTNTGQRATGGPDAARGNEPGGPDASRPWAHEGDRRGDGLLQGLQGPDGTCTWTARR